MSGRIGSESELIQRYLAPLAREFGGAFGLADDCAALAPPPGLDLVLTTDAIAAGVHFFPDDRPEDVAWKALAVNVSDLAAKGAAPIAYQMALSFPEAPEHDWLARFSAGLGEAQQAFAIGLSGGDTDRRPGPLTVTITAIGSVPAGRMIRRGSASPGDRLFVSGTIGDSALGLKLRLDPGLGPRSGLSDRARAHLLDRYARPHPRIGLRQALLDHAGAAMDVSDGLAKDLGRMCAASGCRATVDTTLLPLSEAARRWLATDPSLLASIVAGGDDYEILAAVPVSQATAFAAAAAAADVSVAHIGQFESGAGATFLAPDGGNFPLDRAGWDHF